MSPEEDVVIDDNHNAFELQDRDQEGTPIMDIKSIVGIDGLDSVHMTNDLNLEKISSIRRGISVNGDENSGNHSVSKHEYSDNNTNNNSNNRRSKPTLGPHGSNTTNTTTNSDFGSQNEASPSLSPQAPSAHSSRAVMTHTSRSEDSQSTQLLDHILRGELCEETRKDGLSVDTEEKLYQMFTKIVQNNLHIVATMNPAGGDFSGRAETSCALFNRCVINWWGTLSNDALLQGAKEFIGFINWLPADVREADEKAW